jgi:hypothetical protein
MKISVNCPSYKRPDSASTLDYIPYCKAWVDESEVESYTKNYPNSEIIGCPKGIQGNGPARVRNYILDTEFKNGADVVCLLDDDLSWIERFEINEVTGFGYETHKLNADELMAMIEKYTIMAQDLGAKYWGINLNQDKLCYKHNCPFSTKSMVLGPFSCHLKGTRCRYDESTLFKDDYDMAIQQLNMERIVLRVNAYHYICKQSENVGGLATWRNRERKREETLALQKKWGSNIIKFDTTNKGHSDKEQIFDYNPIVRIPIKGV